MLQRKWLLISVLGLALMLGALPVLFDGLVYERSLIIDGQVWRVFTAHITHVNRAHLLMNLGGLALILWLFPLTGPLWQRVIIWLSLTAGISGWLFWLSPEVQWYAGLSGALHGRLILGALSRWSAKQDMFDLLIAAAVGVKVIWETVLGALPASENLINAPVLTESHLSGAVVGLALWLIIRCFERRALQTD